MSSTEENEEGHGTEWWTADLELKETIVEMRQFCGEE
jgi:hypothetical protein